MAAEQSKQPHGPEWACYGPQGEPTRRQAPELDAHEWEQRARGRREDGNPMPRRDTGDAQASVLLRLLLGWVDASNADSLWKLLAQFESVQLRVLYDVARQENDLGSIAERYLPEDVDPELRELFRLPSNQLQAALVGERDAHGDYQMGRAGLAEREFDALRLWLEPVEESDKNGIITLRLRTSAEIARDLTPERARRQFGRRAFQSVETIERYLANARRKLRLLFAKKEWDDPIPQMTSGSESIEHLAITGSG